MVPGSFSLQVKGASERERAAWVRWGCAAFAAAMVVALALLLAWDGTVVLAAPNAGAARQRRLRARLPPPRVRTDIRAEAARDQAGPASRR